MRVRNPIRRRGALQAAELLFVLPVVFLLIAGLLELAGLSAARQRVVAAAREAARAAAVGGDDEAVANAARRMLGPGLADVAEITATPAASGEPVTVTVRVPSRAAAPDLLAAVGFGLAGRSIEAAAVMRKE